MHERPVDGRSSLAALAQRLVIGAAGVVFADGSPSSAARAGVAAGLDEAMDDFIEEHSQCYEFRDTGRMVGDDRYMLIFQALQKELARLTWPPISRKVKGSRARTLRVLQCLRLLTRDPDLQLMFFDHDEIRSPTRAGSGRPEGMPTDILKLQPREPQARERGRERGSISTPPVPPVPATSSRAPVPYPSTGLPAPPGAPRPGVSASPRRAKWLSPEPRMPPARGVSPTNDNSDEAHGSTGDTERARGFRLPPLRSPRPASREMTHDEPHEVASPTQGSSTDSLLRLVSELVTEYLEELESGMSQDTHSADECAGAGMGTRLTIAVAGLCVAEIVGMLNRYASTDERQSRLTQLGALSPLARLLSGVSDPLVLRCALETLVHFTMRKNSTVLKELVQLCLPDSPKIVPHLKKHGLDKHRCGNLLQQCLALLQCCEEMYEGLAAQLLEQLLESSELRRQLRSLGAVPALLRHLRVDSPDISGEGHGAASGTSKEEVPGGTVSPSQAKKLLHVLACCRKLARDHIELGDQLAVEELLEQGALVALLQLAAHCRPPHEPANAEVLVAALDALAQMCMDDECATALRLQHPDGLVSVVELLLDNGGSIAAGAPVSVTDAIQQAGLRQDVQRSAARLLRFLFAVERNRKAFRQIFASEILGPFVDIGNYIWPLEAYNNFLALVVGLGERELATLRSQLWRYRETTASSKLPQLPLSKAGDPDDWGAPARQVGGYELIECVGSGAFGRVHLARRSDTVENFALKEISLTPLSDSTPGGCTTPRGRREDPEHGDEATAQEIVASDIMKEVRLLRQLDHPNVVQYFSSFTTGSGVPRTLWIVMEFCQGVSLQGFTVSAKEKGFQRLPEEQTWQIFVQICLALRYLHMDKGIAHRDLTPNNVLVQSHTLAVKVTDFGLARQKHVATQNASMMKSMVGTILYSSPEIVQHKPYTHKVDVWALGCLLCKMATLKDPFSGSNPLSVARKIVECDYERLDPAQHSPMLLGTCQRCLAVDPECRPDIQEVCNLITPALVRHLEFSQRTMANRQRSAQVYTSAATRQQQQRHEEQQQRQQQSPPVASLRLGALSPLWDDDCAMGSPVLPAAPSGGNFSPPSQSISELARAGSGDPSSSASASPGSGQASSFPSEEGSKAKVHVPRRILRSAVDPVQKALLVMHRLAFLSQLPAPEGDRGPCGDAWQQWAVHRYSQWLFFKSWQRGADEAGGLAANAALSGAGGLLRPGRGAVCGA